MTILGIVIAIILTYLLLMIIGPYAVIFMVAVLFGLVFSTHQKNKLIYEDLQKIKEKLGIKDTEEIPLSNEEIEAELQQELETRERSVLNQQIEKELVDELNKENKKKGNNPIDN